MADPLDNVRRYLNELKENLTRVVEAGASATKVQVAMKAYDIALNYAEQRVRTESRTQPNNHKLEGLNKDCTRGKAMVRGLQREYELATHESDEAEMQPEDNNSPSSGMSS